MTRMRPKRTGFRRPLTAGPALRAPCGGKRGDEGRRESVGDAVDLAFGVHNCIRLIGAKDG